MTLLGLCIESVHNKSCETNTDDALRYLLVYICPLILVFVLDLLYGLGEMAHFLTDGSCCDIGFVTFAFVMEVQCHCHLTVGGSLGIASSIIHSQGERTMEIIWGKCLTEVSFRIIYSDLKGLLSPVSPVSQADTAG